VLTKTRKNKRAERQGGGPANCEPQGGRLGEAEARQRSTGAEGLELICRQIPLYWPVLPLLWIPALRARADRETRGCANGSCQVGNFGRNPHLATRSQ
jgi:hypothetical protein